MWSFLCWKVLNCEFNFFHCYETLHFFVWIQVSVWCHHPSTGAASFNISCYLSDINFCHILLFFKNPSYILSDFLPLYFMSLNFFSKFTICLWSFDVTYSNYPEGSPERQSNINSERGDKRLRERLKRHNEFTGVQKEKREQWGRGRVFEELMANSFTELMKATVV